MAKRPSAVILFSDPTIRGNLRFKKNDNAKNDFINVDMYIKGENNTPHKLAPNNALTPKHPNTLRKMASIYKYASATISS